MPRVKHYFEPGHFCHITTRTAGGVHAFDSVASKKLVVTALRFYQDRHDWHLCAFVVMANHVHFVASATESNLSFVVGNFKKWISQQLGSDQSWSGWERRFDDNAITHPQELHDVVQYVHNNPVRIGLVERAEDYFWSSARNYAGLKPVAMEVDKQW
jgi:putative transposase